MEIIQLKVPNGTKAKLKTISPDIAGLLREQIEKLVEGRDESALNKVRHLSGSIQGMPCNASTSKDYLKQYALKKGHN